MSEEEPAHNVINLFEGRTDVLTETLQQVLKKGGGGGNSGDMEARVKRLEDDMKEIKGDLKTLLKDTSEIKGKVSGLPSTWQIVGIVGAMLSIAIASGGIVFAAMRYFTTP
ncbi:hypothetical protein MOV76_15415 [Rhizobium sp. PRIMUS64]|uniref:hypothetical protein n=1 Tax=Rhizobium sp. PRIMUS64 TaxID=2908925 RepID=UPI001FF41BFA|nr:hypothetical protein [Rhizobium sp. PRIMUS64]MCJ9692995.1 hypothetical protein [Rhizobium sp. PRIMUS64]